jgi:tetratricopeptide (TPR) repeat protein
VISTDRQRPKRKSREELREELLRPAPGLGYDHDSLAMHLISHDVLDVSESELRRAIWLNPYEARFKQHLAWCLLREKRLEEARQWVVRALEQQPDDPGSREILNMIDEDLMRGGETS